MKYCPTCGAPYETGEKTCPKCGHNLEESVDMKMACPLCNKTYPAGHTFCIADGATLVPIEDVEEAPPAPKKTVLVKASLLNRFFASLLDSLICCFLGIPAIIFYMRGIALREPNLYDYYSYEHSSSAESANYFLMAIVLYILFPGVYFFIKDGMGEGQSLGKKVMGLKVVKVSDGTKCTMALSALRALIGSIIGILPCIGYFIEPIMVLATSDGRRLADRVAGTMVIDV